MGPSSIGSHHLVLCAHGTDSPAGREVVRALRAAVAAALPSISVLDAYVDVQEPAIGDVLSGLPGEPVVVVPLLFCHGYHIEVDIADAVAAHGSSQLAGALGPAPELTTLLVKRLQDGGATPGEPVILAAAGSSRERATRDAAVAAELLAAHWGGPVTVAFGSAAHPRVRAAVEAAHANGHRAVIAAYLLGPGHFHDVLRSSGADLVSEPLGADPILVQLILRRHDEAARRLR